jgi:hypothetical protein
VLSTRIRVTFQCPDVGFGCPDVFTLNAAGRVSVERSSYNVEADRILGYGQSLKLGHRRCVSRTAGLTCTSLCSGHGFFLSRERLEDVVNQRLAAVGTRNHLPCGCEGLRIGRFTPEAPLRIPL